jgi:ATP-dependent RNA helicase DDX18/HAS1
VQEGVVSATNSIEDKPVSFFSKKQFEELGYSKQLIEVTRSLGIDVPSKIQAISAYGVSTGKPCIIADQTGSGKTLGYLLPSIQRMLDQRKVRAVSQVSPYLVILTPTTELAT